MIGLIYKQNENYYCKKILETYNFNKDKENCSNKSYCADYDEEYYHEKCVDLILETTRKIWWIKKKRKKRKKKKYETFFKLRTFNFPPEI